MSPRDLDMAMPPGHARRGPIPFSPFSGGPRFERQSLCTFTPTAFSLSRSGLLSSSLWQQVISIIFLLVSRNTSESPTFATVNSQPHTRATETVVPVGVEEQSKPCERPSIRCCASLGWCLHSHNESASIATQRNLNSTAFEENVPTRQQEAVRTR